MIILYTHIYIHVYAHVYRRNPAATIEIIAISIHNQTPRPQHKGPLLAARCSNAGGI